MTAEDITYFDKKGSRLQKAADKTLFHSMAVRLDKDNRTGEDDGDSEQLWIDFTKMSEGVNYLNVWITLYNTENLRQHFGEIKRASARIFKGTEIVNPKSKNDILAILQITDMMKYDSMTALHAVRFFNNRNNW